MLALGFALMGWIATAFAIGGPAPVFLGRTIDPAGDQDFSVAFDADLGRAINTDSKRLLQIVKNLLSNAFKFTEKGHVKLKVERAHGGWNTSNDHLNTAGQVLAFSVEDSGIGIPPDEMPRLFEPFWRGERADLRNDMIGSRKRILFSTQLAKVDSSMLGVLKKVDSTFRIRKSQKYTAVNKDGFEVDIIRRERAGDDPHPVKLSDEDEDFWVVQARRANVLLDSPGFSAVIVATNGTMARMNTVHPATFVAFKRWMASQPDREALKRRRDVLQADAVQTLLDKYLPQV